MTTVYTAVVILEACLRGSFKFVQVLGSYITSPGGRQAY